MNKTSFCAVALTLALSSGLAAAQAASGAEPRPSGTTPPNTVPYTPGQAATPSGKKITSAQRKEARATRDEAIKACGSETDAKAKKQCVKTAKQTYHRAVTP
jgi:hypothetical protein